MRSKRASSLLAFAFLSIIPLVARTEIIASHIEHIYEPESPNDLTYVLLSANGRVLRLRLEKRELYKELSLIRAENLSLRIDYEDLGDHDRIRGISTITEPQEFLEPLPADKGEDGILPPVDEVEVPLATPQWLYSYFRGKKLRSQSQCFHRAYVWAHDAWVERQLPTTKIFLFFTRKYIRAYNYRWWFHVSPSITESGVESVLDATFTGGPRSVQAWTNVFMKNDAVCPTIPLYYGHANHHQDQWCYLRKTSMYYYHPNTVEKADRGGYQETAFEERGLYYAERSARPR